MCSQCVGISPTIGAMSLAFMLLMLVTRGAADRGEDIEYARNERLNLTR